MAEVVVIGYPDKQTAERVVAVIEGLQKKLIVEVAGLAIVGRDAKGKYLVETPSHPTRAGAAGGAIWGLLFGALLFVPIAGLAVGGLVGASAGKLSEMGVKKEFIEQCNDVVLPGTYAVVAIVVKATADKAVEALKPYGGKVLRTSLSEEAEDELTKALVAA